MKSNLYNTIIDRVNAGVFIFTRYCMNDDIESPPCSWWEANTPLGRITVDLFSVELTSKIATNPVTLCHFPIRLLMAIRRKDKEWRKRQAEACVKEFQGQLAAQKED